MAIAFERVLCATDLSDLGDRAVEAAFAAVSPSGTVTLIHVVPAPPVPSPLVPHYGARRASPEELAARQREAAERLSALARAAGGARFEVETPLAAEVAATLVQTAERIDADLICLATHSRTGLAKLVLGSAAHDVLHDAGRPVLLVPPSQER